MNILIHKCMVDRLHYTIDHPITQSTALLTHSIALLMTMYQFLPN